MAKKVFELAKELEIGAIELVEKLKGAGFNVRNHMASIEDSDLEKVMELMKPKDPVAVKKTKKKTTKNKTANKKTAKKTTKKTTKKSVAKTSQMTVSLSASKKSSFDSEQSASSTDTKKTVVRRKTVVRKKNQPLAEKENGSCELSLNGAEPQSESKEQLGSVDQPQDQVRRGLTIVSEAESSSDKNIENDASKLNSNNNDETKMASSQEKDSSGGLRIVAMPDPSQANSQKSKTSGDGTSTSSSKTSNTNQQTTASSDDDDKGANSKNKKRLGGLASMMSGKKVNKSQALTQTRADSELKSYSALSGVGRPIYSQVKRKKVYMGPSSDTNITEVKEAKRVIKIHGGCSVQEIAKKLRTKLKEFINNSLDLNLLLKGEDYIGIKLATQLAATYDYRVEDVKFDEEAVIGIPVVEDKNLEPRDAIITIMGHVDHGKTTLLDYIRNSKVTDGEAGGITQHIGAYKVKVGDKSLTFLDTPGHAAFASMRERGARVTDIVILVVAADDGVMPQTKESIKFIEDAGVPMIVAINKMDKPDVNPDRVKNELTEFNITPEEWGGDTLMVPISALKGDGIDNLLESIALTAEMSELKANHKKKAEGIVVESKMEAGRGPVATILIQEGNLKKGDSIVVGEFYGRARSLTDHLGKELKSAGPSTPVQILGLNEAPHPGDILNVVKNEREAKKIAENRINDRKLKDAAPKVKKISLEDFFATAAVSEEEEVKILNLIIRTDVQGSFEAIKQSLEPLSNTQVEVKILGGGVGPISDSDVKLADASSGIIIGFNMRPMTSARKMAEDLGVDVKTYSIIYELIGDVKLAIEGMLIPDKVEKFIGRAQIKETFSVPKLGMVAGLVVIDGSLKLGCHIRLLRDGKILHEGELSSLKRFKDDVKEVKSGYECGAGLKEYNTLKVDDIFEAYIFEEIKKSLDDVLNADAQSALAAAKANEEAKIEDEQGTNL